MIKKLIYLTLFVPLAGKAQITVIKPSVKQPTAFAIITDNRTYANTKEAMHRYKTAVESDGLATYLICGDWQTPDQVKQEIIKIYKECPSLEGLVLVGDVPIVLVRNAQHMTTAFKMNEKTFSWNQSSVPTDRFYDDLNLKFEFIKQDSVNQQYFYYKLREDSPQQLSPTFYSARIKYPRGKGRDKYAAIAAYLRKAADAKSDKSNQLDQVFSFNGSSYNTDCLIVWMDEEKAYKENFPLAFGRQMGFKHWNFRMKYPMKYRLFSELQRKDLDLFMFHEHGMPTEQLINDEPECTDFENRYKMFKSTLYNAVMNHAGKRDKDSVRIQMQTKRQVNEAFFKDLENPWFWETDSIRYADERIVTADLMKNALSTHPKIIVFDACYNGSFNEDDYIAGQYIFNDGQTLVAQGNTRNVLQDRWTIEMIGLLSHGVRVGQYNKLIASLEGHLLGDPTFRFAPIEANTLSTDMTIRKNDKTYWMDLLNSPYADVQSLAMRMLADADTQKELSPLFFKKYQESGFNTVRMEAIKLLSRYQDAYFIEALRKGLNDAYEMVARLSAIYSGFVGDDSLLPAIVEALVGHNERLRVQMSANKSLSLYPEDKVKKTIEDYYAKVDRLNKNEEKKRLLKSLERIFAQEAKNHQTLMDETAPEAKRISAIRNVRNYTFHSHVDDYLDVIRNASNPLEVRVIMSEALGWFTNSVQRPHILGEIKKMQQTANLPEDLKKEIEQTIKRLSL